MMRYQLFLMFCLVSFISSCNQTAVPTEFSKACIPENEKRYIEISGFLDEKGSVYCSNRSGRMECSFSLRDNPGSEKRIGAEIEVGTGANAVEELKKSYKPEDVKIRDNSGSIINLAERVKLTGQMSISPDSKVCFMTVTKIES